jgi:hypothetical protein
MLPKVCLEANGQTLNSATTPHFSSPIRWQAVGLTPMRSRQLSVRKLLLVQTWILGQTHTSRTCMKIHPLKMATPMAMVEVKTGRLVPHRVPVSSTSQGMLQLQQWQRRWKMGPTIRSAESHSPSNTSTSLKQDVVSQFMRKGR